MSAWSAVGAGTRAVILAAGGALIVGVGYLGWQSTRPAPETPAIASGPEVSEPAAATAVADDPGLVAEAPATPAPEPAAVPDLPKIDTWRVAPDGQALVAGMAAPQARVEVVVDGAAVAAGDAGPSGEFAILFTLAPNDQPSLMWLMMDAAGTTVKSNETVALAPITGPALAEETALVAEPPPAQLPEAVAEVPPTALLLTDDGPVVLQGGTAVTNFPPASIMIDSIAYSPAGEVMVGGRGTPGSGLRIYVDNAEKLAALVPDDGRWLVTLLDTAPGIYTLRADQLDASGKVTSRFETPFKRETLEDLAAVAAVQADTATTAAADPAPEETAPEDPGPEAAVVDAAPEAVPEPVAAPETVAAAPVLPPPASEAVVGAADTPQPVAAAPVTITVQPGFTLWGIAQDRYGDGVMYVQVFDANREKIKDPNLIYPGQVFAVPAGVTAISP